MDPLTAPARSWLFVPATRPDRFPKAAASGADRIIVDLEDAVAPPEKAAARRALLEAKLPGAVPVYLRVNGCGTEWFADDLAAAARLPVTGVMLPKAEAAEQIERTAAGLGADTRIVPIVESALGLWNAAEIARGPRVERLAFGAIDFEVDTGMKDEGEVLSHARSQVAVASRVAGIGRPVDSVSVTLDDRDAIEADTLRARRFGFAGKLCIHPRQVEIVNRVFRPSDADVEWARALLEALAALTPEERGAFSFRGAMVDRPVVERARLIVAQAGGDPGSGGER